MPSSPPDTMAQVKKGFRNFLHRKGRSGSEGAGSDQIHVVSPPGHSEPVEAPPSTSTKTPQLTTPIPGSSLGPEAHHAGEESKSERESPIQPMVFPANGKAYAEGMSATSGPLGSSLEEVEEFEKQAERRSSVKAEDAAAAAAAVRKTEENDESGTPSGGEIIEKATEPATTVEDSNEPVQAAPTADPA